MGTVSIRIVSSMATREVLAELADRYAAETGCRVVLESAGGVDVARRVRDGETVDVVVLAAKAIGDLVGAGRLLADSRVDLFRSGIAVAVRAGAAQPDISTEAAVKAAVLAAATLGYSTGPSGVYLEGLFARWGVHDQLRPRIVQAPPGVPVGRLVACGEVELGFQQLSELMHLTGIAVLGPLPQAIQSITVFSGGVSVASSCKGLSRRLLASMTQPQATGSIVMQGMEPA